MSNTLIEILKKTTTYLENKKVEKSRFLAEKILSEALNITRLEIYTNFEKILTDGEIKIIREKVKKYNEKTTEKILENSVRSYYEKTKKYLEEKNIKEYSMITNIIFSKLLNVDLGMIFIKYNDEFTEELVLKLKEIITKLVKQKIPIQYIFNEQVFYGYNFYVDKNVLIPRLDTEFVVEKALELIYKIENPKVLDLCCGSGAIGIVISKENSSSMVLGSDISENAIKISNLNKENLKAKNIKFIVSDLFNDIKYTNFDLIVSNPPYIAYSELDLVDETVLNNEPKGALFAENDGLYFYEEISRKAKEFLNENGYILFEIGYKQGEKVKNILIQNGYENVNIGKDLNQNDRFVYAKKGKNES